MIVFLQTLLYIHMAMCKALANIMRPFYEALRSGQIDFENDDVQAWAEYDEEKGVVFYPPVYTQRYAAVLELLQRGPWAGKISKLVDLSCNDGSFIKCLKDMPELKTILGVDMDAAQLKCVKEFSEPNSEDRRKNNVKITLLEGNAADPDYRLIGCDAVIAIELIEHMLPHDIDRMVHTIFGFIKPWIVVLTTPNSDFNELFTALESNGLRRLDHFFEWSRVQFNDWCGNIVLRYPNYEVKCMDIGPGPIGTEHLGGCSQLALFTAKKYLKRADLIPDSLAVISDVSRLSLHPGILEEDLELEETNYKQLHNSEHSVSTVLSASTTCCGSCCTSATSVPCHHCCLPDALDITTQCDVDRERAKQFMFNDFDENGRYVVIVPRPSPKSFYYERGDVSSRLNSSPEFKSSFPAKYIKLFIPEGAKGPQELTEVFSDLKQLTKAIHLKQLVASNQKYTWNNICWGDNPVYWNHYFTVVKEFDYPSVNRSQSCLLDIVDDEMKRLVDMSRSCTSLEGSRHEIPIRELMGPLKHMDQTEETVKELLEWNGYEVSGVNVVVLL